MNSGLILAAAAAAFSLAASPARAETRSLELDPFDRIAITSGIGAVVTVGGEQAISIESDNPELLGRLRIDVRDGTLRAEIDYNWLDTLLGGGILATIFGERPQVTIRISVPALTGAEATSGALVEIDKLNGESLRLEASSGARLEVATIEAGTLDAESTSGATLVAAAGSCERLNADASSGATLDLGKLECAEVIASASSGATARVFARDAIDAEASSGASVAVLGEPERSRVNSSSGGNVRLD
ncbi:MAG: DUF2807 domain-containing protein [Cucumibacter sp.]